MISLRSTGDELTCLQAACASFCPDVPAHQPPSDTPCFTSIAAGADGKISHEPLMLDDIQMETHDISMSDPLL